MSAKIPKPPAMPPVKIPPPPGTPEVKIPPPPGTPSIDAESDLATGGRTWGAVDPNQIDLGTVLVTIGHFCRILGENPQTVNKKLKGLQPAKIIGSHALYLLKDMVNVKDFRDNPGKSTTFANRHEAPVSFTGDEPPPHCTPTELKTFYQAKQAEQNYIKIKNDNDLTAGLLLQRHEVERTIIEAFKIVAHYLDNLGDILERDGVITHAEVDAVDQSVDSIREQLAAALRDITNSGVDNL